ACRDDATLQLAVLVVVRQEQSVEIEHPSGMRTESALPFRRLAQERFAYERADRAIPSIADDIVDDAASAARKRHRKELLVVAVGVDDALIAIDVGHEERQGIEDRAVEVLAAIERLFRLDLRADIADRAGQAQRPAGRIARGLAAQAAPDRRAGARIHATAHVELRLILEVRADLAQDERAIVGVQ